MAKILLVEDDAFNLDMAARRLKWQGYQVITAENGAQALTLAMTERPNLILMDMGLPVLNGWQAAHELKAAEATQAIPIIALTAYALSDDRGKCLAAGCDEYETKPVEFARLLAKMRTLLNKS